MQKKYVMHLHEGDLPEGVRFKGSVAVDTETMGLKIGRDPLCLVQMSDDQGNVHMVQFIERETYDAPRLAALMEDPAVVKIFHYGRFDMASIKRALGCDVRSVFCTKIASKLVRTYSDRHGLKELCRELLGVELSKQQQSSDWGASSLKQSQLAYAAGDVLYLHDLKDALEIMLAREGRLDLARACFLCLTARVDLDIAGWENEDIFAH